MSKKRKVTVQMSVWFRDISMEDTDAAIQIVRSVVTEAASDCEQEISRALESAGAQDVQVQFISY